MPIELRQNWELYSVLSAELGAFHYSKKKKFKNVYGILSNASYLGMGEFRKNVYLLTKKEATTLTLSEIKELRKKLQYQSKVTFFENMKDDDVRILLENQFSPILSNKR